MHPVKKDPAYPAMHWHPTTGESKVFNSAAEVPDGWLDKHPAHPDNDKAAPKAKDETVPMSKADVLAALTAGNVAFAKNIGHKAAYELLVKSLKDHLTANNIAFPDDATGPQLFALVPKS